LRFHRDLWSWLARPGREICHFDDHFVTESYLRHNLWVGRERYVLQTYQLRRSPSGSRNLCTCLPTDCRWAPGFF
jgi:hypothetical protein